MNEKLNPIYVFVSAFGVSSFAGLAALLRAGKQVNSVAILSAVLNSGMLGLAIALVWYNKFQDNIYFLIGICVLAGLGGATLVDFMVAAFKSGGLSIGGLKVGLDVEEKEEKSVSK
jgi:uncharacterized membrane-anchored protein